MISDWDAVVEAAARLPRLGDPGPDGRPRRVVLPRRTLPAVVTVPGVVVRVGVHRYSWPDDGGEVDVEKDVDVEKEVDDIHLWADRPALRALGLLLSFALIGAGPQGSPVELRLDDPAGHVPAVRVRPPGHPPAAGSRSLSYRPRRRSRYPLRRRGPSDVDGPVLEVRREPVPMNPSTAIEALDVEGTHRGLARLARLFLDAGDPSQPEAEFVLEGEWGFGGLAAGSAELTLWLPGSVNWPPPAAGEV